MKKYYLLIVALVLGTFLRLYQLASVPNGLTWDEAAIGYNAYSILKTGRDEHGAFLPVVFKSFGDYKPGAYIYLTVPSVAVFGLNEFAVRLPSALAGVLAIFGIYLLTSELFLLVPRINHHQSPTSNHELIANNSPIGSFASLALALSPWHVHFSHGAWEVNVFVTLAIFALYYLLRFIKNRSTIYPSLLFACLSLAMYQAAKLLIPLLFLLFITLYWSEFWSRLSPYLKPPKALTLLPFVFFGAWIFFGSIFGSAGNRLSRLSIFSYRPELAYDSLLFHHQAEISTKLVASRYLYHFSPEVLFYEGPRVSLRGHLPGVGVLNPLEFIWLALGLSWLVCFAYPKKGFFIVIGLLLIAPIPASLTLEEFSTVRSLFMAVPLAIISGLGLSFAVKKLKYLLIPLVPLYLLLSLYTFDLYFNHSQTTFALEFNYGYKQVVELIKDNPSSKVIITDIYGQPYIYYLFYTAYDPATYQKNDHFVDGGIDVGKVEHVGNVDFQQFGRSELGIFKDTLFIGTEGNINNQFDIAGPDVALFRQIETPDHHILFRVIKTRP